MASIEPHNRLLTAFGKETVKDREEWARLKTIDKTGLKGNKPKTFSELRITSGSTGEPCYIYYAKESVEAFIWRTVKSIELSGITEEDVVLNLFAYGNYVPGSMYEKACQRMNVPVIPLGAPNTYPMKQMVEVILKLKPSAWCSVPSYALGLINAVAGIDKTALPKTVMVAGEALFDTYIESFNKQGIKVVNHFGLTECPAIGVSIDNEKRIHVINDGILVEIEKNDNVEELVITDLNNFSTPIIRYNTRDVVGNIDRDNEGNITAFELHGRNDDLVKLNGILTSKKHLSNSLLKFTEKFFIELKTKDDRDLVTIHLPESLQEQESDIMKSLKFLIAKHEIVYEGHVDVPKTITNKAKYIIDLRK